MKQFYRVPGLSAFRKKLILDRAKELSLQIDDLQTETCYYVGISGELKKEEEKVLFWLLSETFEPQNFSEASFLVSFLISPIEISDQ
jgi:phosphoribosylformylglycinamidine synthase